MKFGVCIPNYGETSTVDGLRTVALEAEKMGYDSVWTTDHVLMPTQSGTPYERILDSITSLAYLAPLTSIVKLGISSLITAMRILLLSQNNSRQLIISAEEESYSPQVRDGTIVSSLT